MKDVYVDAFRDVVQETSVSTGFELPEPVEAYLVMLLASKVEVVQILPTNSFAESYLELNKSSRLDAKELGDTCLFVTGVFPDFGKSKGLNRRYYQSIGSSSYEIVSDTMNGELFSMLAKHFVFLSEFIEQATHSSKHELNNLFR